MNKRIKMTVGEAIVKFLDSQYVAIEVGGSLKETKYVENFYTIFGHGCVLGIGSALSNAKHSLKVLQGRNEQGMAQAAISYAKMHNRTKIIPCVSSIGPGSANMVTAAATATVNNIPLLLFMGDSFASRQPDPVLQQVEQLYNPTITTADAFKAVTRYFDKITRPEMIMSSLINAMRVLTDPAHSGAVAIAVGQDVFGESCYFEESFFEKRVNIIRRTKPCDYEVKAAADAIKKAKKPLAIVGGGVRYSMAGEIAAKFFEKYNIPFAETQAGKSAIVSSHPLNLGGIGVTGNLAANTIAKDCDLVIGLGTRFSDFTTSSKWLYADKKVVTVNASDFHAGKMDSVKVVSDIEEGLKAINLLLDGYRSEYYDEIALCKKAWDKEMDRLGAICYSGKDFVPENKVRQDDALDSFTNATGGTICQTAAIASIRKLIDKDAIVVGAAGSLPGCLQRMWTTDTVDSYNMEYGYSCMGYEIAGAFGAKLAFPNREVYAFCGDGSYNMLHSEMLTALQENKKINVLLFDNASFGCINNLQMGQGVDALCTESRFREGDNPIRKGEFMNIDYAMCAKGYGFVAYTAKTMAELEEALIDAKKQTKSTLIDIKVLPKTMTDGYGGWWNVGVSDMPYTERGVKALEERTTKLKEAKLY
ncbi:3D-(3,5/4)-trihydroxycyclohexane-1,2-dione acylhydrolase (decyclizing) [bacterium]|nr:3D-(3,5/4)-trihydroxycyclohexane-1,2-dione acylhydrolase (decyclizing) [bacterium]